MEVRVPVVISALLLSQVPALAQTSDLSRIPSVSQQSADASAPPAPDNPITNLFLQNDLGLATTRSPVPVPLAPSPDWLEQLIFDSRLDYNAGSGVHVIYSGQLNLRAEQGLGFPNHENIRNDLREAYLSADLGDGFLVEAGRVNFKSGVGLGYNPTDFFKARSAVEPLSADPAVLREDRLGTLMALGEYSWNGGTITALFVPKVTDETPIYFDNNLPSFRPVFDRTNAADQGLITAVINVSDQFSPEFLFNENAGTARYGTNLTYLIGRSVVVYAEWSGRDHEDLIRSALDYGIVTGTLPLASNDVLPQSNKRGFNSQLDAGASYTTPWDITFNLEYVYNGEGFTGADWHRWFATGVANANNPLVTGTLWYIRGYAQDQQDPVARNNVFVRADWTDAIIHNLHVTGFALIDGNDGSALTQVTADYYVSDRWTVGGLWDGYLGRRRSEFGSLPNNNKLLLKLTRYL